MDKIQKTRLSSNLPVLFFDGGSRGNPGKAAGAGVIVMPDGKSYTATEYLDFATNNEAEYTGLIVGLQQAEKLGIKKLAIRGDSNLVVNQINGSWKIKSDRLRTLYQQARSLINKFSYTSLDWIPREQNKLADAAANYCLDRAQGNKPKTPVTKNPQDLAQKIDANIANIIQLGDRAQFRDYKNLKSGRDRFSQKNLASLKKLIPENVQAEIAENWDGNDIYLAKVYRWYLRGLPATMAIIKVRTDAEIEKNVTGVHPWQEENNFKKQQKSEYCYYAKGDIVTISNLQNSQEQNQGTIIAHPQKQSSGKWLLTVEIEEQNNPLKLKDY